MNLQVARSVADPESARRVSNSIRALLQHQPFYGSLALAMPPVEDFGCRDMASEGRTLRYNPQWVARSGGDEIRLTIGHLVTALALKHHTRRDDRNHQRWQQASHLVTLPYLREAGLTDVPGGLDMSCEAAYKTIPPSHTSDDDEPSCSGDSSDQTNSSGGSDPDGPPDPIGGGGDGADSDGNTPPGEILDAPTGDEDDNGEDEQSQVQGGGSGGSGGRAQALDARQRELREEEQRWDRTMHQAHQFARAQGLTPGGMSELIDGMHRTKVDWRTLLRRFMTSHANADYTWSRPNRRHIDSGLYLPALYSEAMGPVVFAIDTSASLNTESLERLWSEIRQAVAEVTPDTVTVIQCDASVQSVEHHSAHDLPETIAARGRGGTLFSPVFAAVEQMPPPACLVYLTDLYCSDYPEEPEYPVLWAVTGQHDPDLMPPFGERVDID